MNGAFTKEGIGLIAAALTALALMLLASIGAHAAPPLIVSGVATACRCR